MVQTDTTFFTNEPNRDLYSRFAAILKSNTQYFDALVGYFRSSGFFRMYPFLEAADKIRILVGLNVDHFTMHIVDRANDEISYNAISSTESKNIYSEDVQIEFEKSATTYKIERGVQVFIDWLKSGKMEMHMYTEAPVHAKVYIMRKNQEKVPDTYGTVITGSSNFSESGLVNNLEFNVELKNSSDVEFALAEFEKLWDKSIDIKETYINTVEKKTWMCNDITPYQLYLKTLYEFFREEINLDKETFNTLLPSGYKRLQYQIDAVIQAKKKLDTYDGVFISDVVGLGKTYICAMLANTFDRNSYKLFICPPVLVDYWRSVLQDFDVARCDVESLGKLDKIIEHGTDKYSYIFIDEAHRFRNSNTESFTKLHQICRGKKVILISATPINNYTSDIENLIYLFQSKHNGNINGIKDIEGFFRGLDSKLKKLPKDSERYLEQLRNNSEAIRDKLLREIMIRRTRSEIQEYYADDLEKQGITFPKVGTPEKIIYEFDQDTDEIFSKTINIIHDFNYARYMPLTYLKDESEYKSMSSAQHNMSGFMKGILIKRLESSFYAFRKTLDRFIRSYIKFIDMVNTGEVYISNEIDVFDLLDNGEDEKLFNLVEQQDVRKYTIDQFEPYFLTDLNKDLADLKSLEKMWASITNDPKIEEFKKELTTNNNMIGNKIIVFTESSETAEYLCIELKEIYGDRVINFSSHSPKYLKTEIEDSFNPLNRNHDNDKYDILITTDVLSEGVNLQGANVLVNYDLPWNPTRIMQRVGRINRVGTEYDRIYVYNFFPTAQSERYIPLEERILEKLQAFHDTLGEDIKYLSDDEEISPKKLFTDLNRNMDEDEESTNPELAYLRIIRQIRDEDPLLFDQIKRLPKKAKAGRNSDLVNKPSTLGFIRKGALKTFFISSGQEQAKQLTFMDAIKYIEATPEDNKINIGPEYYDQYEFNNNAFDDMILNDDIVSNKSRLSHNDNNIIKILRGLRNDYKLTDDQIEMIDLLINRWIAGDISSGLTKDVLKIINKGEVTNSLELYYEIMRVIPTTYFAEKEHIQNKDDEEKQVILSVYLENKGIANVG